MQDTLRPLTFHKSKVSNQLRAELNGEEDWGAASDLVGFPNPFILTEI